MRRPREAEAAGWVTNLLWFLAIVGALAFSGGCKQEQPEAEQKAPPSASAEKPAEPTSQTLAADQLRSLVPQALLPTIKADARRAFAGYRKAHQLWPSDDERALAYYRSTQLLARLARSEEWATSEPVKRRVRNIMIDVYRSRLFRRMIGEVKVTDKEIESYYKANLDKYVRPGRFWIRYIFLNTVDYPDQAEQKKALAEKALAEIKSGRLFQDVARKYSDAEADKGQIVGPVPYGEINPVLEKAVLALEPGQVTGVVKTKYGYNILRLEKNEPPTTQSLESVRESIRSKLLREKSKAARGRFDQLLKKQYPATKRFAVVDLPSVKDDDIVVKSEFLTVTVADYRRFVESFPPRERNRFERPEERAYYLEQWIDRERIDYAARRLGIDREPEVLAIRRYVTDRTLAEMCLDRLVAGLPAPTDEEIEKYYEENKRLYTRPAQVRLREIQISYRLPAGSSPRQWYLAEKKAQKKAEEVMAKLKAGADFVELVKQYSTAESAKKDGDIGFIVPSRKGREVADAIAKLKVGQWTEPLKLYDSFVIYRLEERKPEELIPLNEPQKMMIRKRLEAQKRRRRAAEIRVALACAYRDDLPVEKIREIARNPGTP